MLICHKSRSFLLLPGDDNSFGIAPALPSQFRIEWQMNSVVVTEFFVHISVYIRCVFCNLLTIAFRPGE